MTRPTVHTQGGLQADTLHLSAADSAAGARTVGAAGSARETAAIGETEGSGADSPAAAGACGADSPGTAESAATPGRAATPGTLGEDSLGEGLPGEGTATAFPGPFGLRDTVGAASATEAVYWRDTTSAAVFGEASTLADPQPASAARPLPTDNAPFQGFVLLLAVLYAVLLYSNLGDIGTLLSRAFHEASSRKRFSEDSGSSGFSRFLHITTAIGLLFSGLLAVKFAGWTLAGRMTELFAGAAPLVLSLATTLAAGAVVLYQHLVLGAAGAITVSRPFVAQIILLKRTYFSLAVVIIAPVLLLHVLCDEDSGRIWLLIGLAEAAVTAILYLKETLSLFLSKNFSILHWFLYLCTVELFPVSLLWLLITRG